MLMKQKGIIIKSVDYGESDKIITILNEYGAKNTTNGQTSKKLSLDFKQIHSFSYMAYLFIINGEAWEH